MFKKISLIALGIIVGILIVAAMKPDEFRVERSVVIQAPAEKIFPLINDLRAFSTWSPYEKIDPAMQRSYSDPASGVGAVYAWQGNDHVGQGRMEITASTPPDSVLMRLDFQAPMEAHNTAAFTLTPEGAGTRVSWAMFGPAPFMSKIITVFFSMDSMVGAQFSEGLENLKQLAEK
ncbi:MAG TPA: SRPBCC family protein [Rhodocyclaceae bacterium]|nr:SRPBCC family protein [Rhodocyclaceae bacterium]